MKILGIQTGEAEGELKIIGIISGDTKYFIIDNGFDNPISIEKDDDNGSAYTLAVYPESNYKFHFK